MDMDGTLEPSISIFEWLAAPSVRPSERLPLSRGTSQYRQGDVFLQRVTAVPDAAQDLGDRAKQTVLALGELTGHAHVLRVLDGELVEYATTTERFVTLVTDGLLTHEEHATIVVPAGSYLVVRQREYRPRPQPSAPPRTSWVVE